MYSHWIQHIRRTIATQIADSQSSDLHGRVQPTHARDKSNVLEANVQHNDGHILQIIDPIVPCQTSGDYYQRWRRQRRPLPHVEQLCTCTSQQQNVKCTKESYVCKLCANCVQTSCVQTGVQNGVRQTILAKLFAVCITKCRPPCPWLHRPHSFGRKESCVRSTRVCT